MAHKVLLTFIIALSGICTLWGQSTSNSEYLVLEDIPDGSIYLPAPPDTASLTFAYDFLRWQWGKTMRNNAQRGPQASLDSQYGIERMATLYSNLLGITISSQNTPVIYSLLNKVGNTCASGTVKAKEEFVRKRPFVQMHEHPWGAYDNEEELFNTGSYPSVHTAFGWGTALVLAEIAPQKQNVILQAGYEYGNSRVIVGTNWQSDVDAGRLCAASTVARMHNDPIFINDLNSAKLEYNSLTTQNSDTTAGLPQGNSFLAVVADTTDIQYYSDVVNYWQAKTDRDGERGNQAVLDAQNSDMAFLSSFAHVMGLDTYINSISAIPQLLTTAKATLEQSSQELLTATPFRKRPYVKMGEATMISSDEEALSQISSYPSANAMVGWGLALLLSEIAPDYQDQILERGYQYGESQIITGYEFYSDVQDGRILASAVIARLHADADFAALLQAAKTEFSTLSQ